MCYCVPGCTDLIQLIDTGIGHSIWIYVGHDLDKWLSFDENLEAWEGKLSAKDYTVAAGDEILVLADIDTKTFQHAKDIFQIVYQLALSAGVVLSI